MAVTNTGSAEYQNQTADPVVELAPTDQHGRVRMAHFTFDSITGDANSTLDLIKMPAGRVRVLGVHMANSAFTATAALSLGHTGYTAEDGTAEPADDDAFATGVDVATASTGRYVHCDVLVKSRGGFIVRGTVKTAGGASETLSGYLTYTVD